MASDWKELTLGEIAQNISRPFNFKAFEEVTFINTGDVLEGQFLHSNRVSKIGLPGQAKKEIQEGDILFSEIRPANKRFALVDFDPIGYVVSTKFMVIKKISEDIDDRFFYILLTNQITLYEFQRIAESRSGTFPQITFDAVAYFPVKIPPLPEQKAIAHILGSLDEKIELNRQMNETLEAMAQALFKSWFVDFDPVIDNALAAGNAIPDALQKKAAERAEQRKNIEKKDNSDIQHLFPNEFEFTEEMGWIPKGWAVTTLESLAVISSSKRIFAKEYKTEGIPFFRGKEISLLSKGESFTQDIFISKERFHELKKGFGAPNSGDLLLTSVGTIGNVYLVQEGDEFYFKDGNLTWFSKYKTEIKGAYLSTWFSTRQAYLAIENIKIGSTQQAITISSLNGIEIVQPKDKIVSLFNEFSENIVEKTSILIKERRTLAKIRDTLLPKLMSGELRIPDAAGLVDEAI